MSKIKRNRGFSLVELIIVIAIIASLTAIIVPTYLVYVSKARQTTCQANRASLEKVLKIEMTDKDYATLQDAYNAKTAAEPEWASQFVCPAGGKISAMRNEVICSKHSSPDFLSNVPEGNLNSQDAIRKYYEANGNSLPSIDQKSELWQKLFGSDKLYQNPAALYWRPSQIKVNGETQYVMFASADNYKDGNNVQASWKGYACYYNGVYYVSTNVAHNGTIDNSSVSGFNSQPAGTTVEEWLAKNGWAPVD